MEFRLHGDPDGGPRLDLDHGAFAYAGKFRMATTGKATAVERGTVVAAAAFSRDRTDESGAWIRYVSVRRDRRGEGIGARLLDVTAGYLLESVDVVRIAVNNPFAYEAAYKAGFGFTGDRTGLAELVLERPAEGSAAPYRAGLEAFAERGDLPPSERGFIDRKREAGPPARRTGDRPRG